MAFWRRVSSRVSGPVSDGSSFARAATERRKAWSGSMIRASLWAISSSAAGAERWGTASTTACTAVCWRAARSPRAVRPRARSSSPPVREATSSGSQATRAKPIQPSLPAISISL
ncbi:MAG: hypothetical protein A2V74_02120 [Acidobacteria bacterium RBG_16_70_10]|nr:MAG: hypothetical protein A2V74_02120 [Acidobacteria bacterium RBG_16_70_10]